MNKNIWYLWIAPQHPQYHNITSEHFSPRRPQQNQFLVFSFFGCPLCKDGATTSWCINSNNEPPSTAGVGVVMLKQAPTA